MTKEAMERPDVEGIEAKLRVADNFIESEAILSEIARSVVPELCNYILVLEENALDREVDILALEGRLALLEATWEALEPLGIMPEGYCFCAHNRDPLKNLKGIPHTGECEAARQALAALGVAKDLAVFGLAFVKDGKRVPAQKVMKNMDIEDSQ